MAETPGMTMDAKSKDNKIYVQETSRPLGTQIYFTSEGDDTSDVTMTGGGEEISLIHNIGDDITQHKIVDFNVKENTSYIHEGYIVWENTNFDKVSLSIIPTVTASSAGTGTYFNAYGPIIVPAAGDGTLVVQPEDIRLIQMPIGIDFSDKKPGFWNADYDSATHTFSNITAAPSGNGDYNMFNVEAPLNRFVNKIMLLKDGFMMMQAAESSELGHGMRLKLSTYTTGTDHDWKASCIITMHRMKTC
jgi:hypothetical protein